jgi:hypothetical protein
MNLIQEVENRILVVRGEKVIMDTDLAMLYGVSAKALKQAVRRNRERFPADFMFELTWEESRAALRSQIVTIKRGEHLKYRSYAFTEQGVAMLSSVLRSERAIRVNIEIVRTFVRQRKMIETHADLARKINSLERKYDAQFKGVFDAIRELMESSKGRIGFHRP